MMFYVNFTLLIVLIINSQSNAQRTKDKMYQPLNGIASCFRRMNGTHQTGCTSAKEGTTGIVHYINDASELDLILSLDNNLKYIPAIPVNEFTKEIVYNLKKSSKISGLVVYETNDTTMGHFSHEDSCPNRYSNLENTCSKPWNKYGTSMLMEDLEIPIFYLQLAEEVQKVKDCFQKFNNFSYETHQDRSLCALELSGFMFAAINTPTCIRRGSSMNFNFNSVKFCDALGDQNVWATLFPIAQPKRMKYVVVAARMDTTSMFSDMVPGAASPVSGMVTLLSTAEVLKRVMPNNKNYDYNVIFMLFNGESYDYLGSQRVVYDMEHERYPTTSFESDGETVSNINLNDIALFIEVSHVSPVEQMYIHYKDDSEEIRKFMNILDKNSVNGFKKSVGFIPPASLHTFLNAKPNMSGVVLADHGDTYKTNYYHSVYDNAANLNFNYINDTESGVTVVPKDSIQQYVAEFSTGLAKSIYEFITNQTYSGLEEADAMLVNELFHCYLENANCTVHHAVQTRYFRQAPLSLYVSVTVAPNIVTSVIGLTLAWFTADRVDIEGPCKPNMNSNIYRYFNMSDGLSNLNETRCFKASMNFTIAKSPAFDIEDYDWASGKYSTWSESVWHDFSMRMFLKPSRSHEIMTISIGTTAFVAAIAIILLIKRKSDVLFESGDTTPTNC